MSSWAEEAMRAGLEALAAAPRLKPGERAEWAKLALFIADPERDYDPFPLNGPVPDWAKRFIDIGEEQ